MKKTMKLVSLAAIATLAACGGAPKTMLTAGVDLSNMDTTAQCGTDFYRYACGGWMEKHPLMPEYARFGSFDALAENNRERLKELIEGLAAQKNELGSVAQKIGDLYLMAMDSVKLNQDGANPIQKELQQIAAIKNSEEFYTVMASMYQYGMYPFFAPYVGTDERNSSMHQVQIYQGGYAMGERDYYLTEDTKEIREAYQEYVAKMFQLSAGLDEKTARNSMKAVMNIETRLAKASRDNVALRDPNANYNKYSVTELKKQYPGFDFDRFLEVSGLKTDTLNVNQPEFFKEVVDILTKTSLNDLIAYLQWQVIDGSTSYLSDEITAASFDFYGKKMSGKQEMRPRWKRAIAVVDGSLSEAVGKMYVEKYFPAAAKERMTSLVKNLQTALGERIQKLEWMSDITKEKAMDKLAAFHVKVGYPDKWKDYSKLLIEKDSYWENNKRANAWGYQEMLAKIGKPVDKDEWLMSPQTVNAYYNPTTNEICFPAAILQPPFFDMEADDAFNYGAIGVVIGHEMTHGFDDQGRQYDKNGNLKDWWTDEDAKQFNERAQVLVNYFDSIEVAPKVYANGKFTLGENIADHGGLQISYQAFKNATAQMPLDSKLGLTPEQRFFLSYAGVWAGNIRPEEVLRLTKSDPHSLGKWRVNGALPHIAAWYEAFEVTEKDAMFLSTDKRASIW